MKKMRITLDYDQNNREGLIKVYNAVDVLERAFGEDNVEIYQTRRGYHVIAHNTGLNFTQVLIMRALLGDDRNRIKLDKELHDKPKQVLFSWKSGFFRKKITKEELKRKAEELL
jgi:hypothetical protein